MYKELHYLAKEPIVGIARSYLDLMMAYSDLSGGEPPNR